MEREGIKEKRAVYVSSKRDRGEAKIGERICFTTDAGADQESRTEDTHSTCRPRSKRSRV